jgi:hypothetical protein
VANLAISECDRWRDGRFFGLRFAAIWAVASLCCRHSGDRGLDVLVQDGGVPIAHGCRLTCSDEQALGCQRCKCSALDARGSINAQSVKFWPVQNNKIDGSDLDRNNYSKMLRHRAILLK